MRFFSNVSVATYFGINIVYASVLAERSVINGPCTGSNNAPGVCIPTAECSAAGGNYISNACPNTPDDIKCCTKASCGSGGNCRWTSQCAGSTLVNQCPGPADFKCCIPKSSSGGQGGGGQGGAGEGATGEGATGTYPTPSLPLVGECKARAVDGARKIIDANKGAVREIFCTRDCSHSSKKSDHCNGMATDMMCSSAGGVRTESGREIAEWVMKNRDTLNLKYVIWGQKIWEVGDDVTPWSGWSPMENRGSITANHWDHVHVSYK